MVRLCEPTYDRNLLINNNIQVHDWPFIDGGVPPPDILDDFLSLCEKRFTTLTLSKETLQSRQTTILDSTPVIVFQIN